MVRTGYHASFDKSVDSPQCHRDLTHFDRNGSLDRDHQEYRIGTTYNPDVPNYSEHVRYEARPVDHDGMITDGYPAERKNVNQRNYTPNHDWTKTTHGNSVQKVLEDRSDVHTAFDKSNHDAWVKTSCSKVLPQDEKSESPKRTEWSKTIPNEPKKTRAERHDIIDSWNTQAAKTLPKEEKRVLDLAPKVAPPPAPKKIMRPEDWESNLKTLPDAVAKGCAQRHQHVYDDIKDSIVRCERRRQF